MSHKITHAAGSFARTAGRTFWQGFEAYGLALAGLPPLPTQAFLTRETRGLPGLAEDTHATARLARWDDDAQVRRDMRFYNDPDCGAIDPDAPDGLPALPSVPPSQVAGPDPLAGPSGRD
jgi:hypothetical protein